MTLGDGRIKKIFSLFFWWNRIYSSFIKNRFHSCGKKFSAEGPIKLSGGKNITVGSHVSFMGMDYLYANNGILFIGNNCTINTNVQLGATGGVIRIADNVLIGPNVVIRAANHGISKHSFIKGQLHSYGEIYVESDVWIGANAVILPNVRLAEGTVVAAGAIVTASTEPYSIVGGVPARKIGERL
jgi:galactoside O-acetyltransferase